MVKQLTSVDFEQFIAAHPVAMVDFSAAWCPPCRMLKPVVEELASEFAGRAGVAMVDVDASGPLAQAFRITSVPTLIFFKDGRPVDQVAGAWPKAALEKKLASFLTPATA